jgi:hypothetical protein
MYYRDVNVAYQEHSGRTMDERCFGVYFSFFGTAVSFWHTLNFLGNRNRLVSAFSETRSLGFGASVFACFMDLEGMGTMEQRNRKRGRERENKTECSILI